MARHREFNREEVLQRARERFHLSGYTSSSMQELLDDMGIGKGSFYAAFDSKEALFRIVMDDYADQMIGRMLKVLQQPGPPLDAIRALLLGAAEVYVADAEHRGCLLVNTVAELAPHDQQLTEALSAHWARLERAVAKNLSAAKDCGDLPSDRSPQALARLVVGIIHSIALRSKFDPRPEVLRSMAKSAADALL